MKKYKSIVLNVPHASIEGIADSDWNLSPSFFMQVKMWTDWYTDYLFKSHLSNIKMVRSCLSRFVVDTERLMNDPLEKIGQGVVYHRFAENCRDIQINEETMLMRYYMSHLQHLRDLLTPYSLLVDCHSFPSSLSDNVDVCIGYNNDWSKPDDDTVNFVVSRFQSYGYRVGINEPYSNSISPECKFIYPSIMIELNKRIYMNEYTLDLITEHLLLKECIQSIYNDLLM